MGEVQGACRQGRAARQGSRRPRAGQVLLPLDVADAQRRDKESRQIQGLIFLTQKKATQFVVHFPVV